MLTAVKKLFSCIVDYSNRADTMNTFWESPQFDKYIKEAASKLVKSQFKKNGKYSKKVTYCSVYDKITFENSCFLESSDEGFLIQIHASLFFVRYFISWSRFLFIHGSL